VGRGAFQQLNDLSEFGHTLCVETKRLVTNRALIACASVSSWKQLLIRHIRPIIFLFIMVYDIKFWLLLLLLLHYTRHNKKAVLSQRLPSDARYISGSNEPLRRYGHSKLFKMAACRQLGFDVTGNSAIRSADPENPEVYRITRCGDMAIRVSWGIWNPILREGEVVGGQRWHHSKERW